MQKYVFHVIVSIVLLTAASSAQAQTPARTQDQMRDAIYLAGVLGRVHAIRVVCNGRDDQYWRVQMKGLLDLEAPESGGLRSSMAKAFNDAYTRESDRWRSCDAAAIATEAEHAAEGRALADRLAMSYFPKR